MLCAARLELPGGVPVSGLAWMVLQGCRPEDPPQDKPGPTDSSVPSTTGTTGDTATTELPGTTEPVPDDQTIGSVRVEWNDMEHLLPNGSSLELHAVFWDQVSFGDEREILVPAEGLDTCEVYRVFAGTNTAIPAQAGELTVTLDGEVWFQGPPNTGSYDVLRYFEARPEPAWNSEVGISATGAGNIGAFDIPLAGILSPGTVGQFSPTHGEDISLDDLTFTWGNPVGGEVVLSFDLSTINFYCLLNDDGHWAFPTDYLPLLEGYNITHSAVYLTRGRPRWIPVYDDKYLQVTVRTQTSWRIDVIP